MTFDITTAKTIILAASAIGAGIVMIGICGIGLGQGIATGKAVEGVSRQPEAQPAILKTLIVGIAITETTGIFAFIIALTLVFANPLINLI